MDGSTESQNIGLLLFYPYRALENLVFERISEAGFKITLAQGRIFGRIGPNGSRLSDLAAQAQVSRPTAVFLVDQLEKAGYVERVPDPTDGRARLVVVSERGHAAVAIGAEVIAAVETEWRTHLGDEEYAALRASLAKLREVTDPYA